MSDIAPGLADPTHGSQRLFRAILEAFAHPGSIVGLPQPPAGVDRLSPAAAAFLLTLVDRDTPLWLEPGLYTDAVQSFVRFHTGAPIVTSKADALFAVLTPEGTPTINGFAIGTDTYPDRSATLLFDLPSLGGGPLRRIRGPGINGSTSIAVPGLPESFWSEWAANRALFPCGVDLVLAAGTDLLALPRSILLEG